MTRKLVIIGAALALMLSWGSKASALTVSDPSLVGTVVDAIPFSDANRLVYTNHLLGMTAVNTETYLGEVYTKYQDLGSGSVSSIGLSGSGSTTITGYEYVLVKYDGPNAGAILFYIAPGDSFVLPSTSDQVFSEGSCGVNCGISGWSAFNPTTVPDGGSTIALLGSALVAFGLLRRRFLN